MLTFLKYLKNKIDKNLFISTLFLTIVILIIIVYCTFFTKISIQSNFDITTMNLKVIDIIYVFMSNSKLILLNLLFGLITIGLYPTVTIIQNVYSLCVIANALVLNNNTYLLLRILPHGIVELFILSLSFFIVIKSWLYIFKLCKMLCQKKMILEKFFENLFVGLSQIV